MLLKTFFFDLYILATNFSLYIILILLFLSLNFLFTTLRLKLIYFILLVITCSIWGFLYNLDGMMLVLLTAEFTIFLLFLMTYTQLYENFLFLSNKKKISSYNFLFLLLLISYPCYTTTVSYTDYYNLLSHIVSSDFFILYYLLFDVLPFITIAITLIIGLFSLFFIALYFNLKLIKLGTNIKLKNIFFLRKQNTLKQNSFKNSMHTFQN